MRIEVKHAKLHVKRQVAAVELYLGGGVALVLQRKGREPVPRGLHALPALHVVPVQHEGRDDVEPHISPVQHAGAAKHSLDVASCGMPCGLGDGAAPQPLAAVVPAVHALQRLGRLPLARKEPPQLAL